MRMFLLSSITCFSRANTLIYGGLQQGFAVFAGCFSLLFRLGTSRKVRVSAVAGKLLAVFSLYYQRDQRSRQLQCKHRGALAFTMTRLHPSSRSAAKQRLSAGSTPG